MVVQVISLKTVKEHQQQVVKVVSKAGAILKMTLSAPQKQEKKGAKTVTVAAVAANDDGRQR
ncbi:Hypothetical protein AKI40_2531 [Enterobacter sp. FY-07]|nr:Hypothetical protein AKI40_2531 [Enterobacter sp. FY-07]